MHAVSCMIRLFARPKTWNTFSYSKTIILNCSVVFLRWIFHHLCNNTNFCLFFPPNFITANTSFMKSGFKKEIAWISFTISNTFIISFNQVTYCAGCHFNHFSYFSPSNSSSQSVVSVALSYFVYYLPKRWLEKFVLYVYSNVKYVSCFMPILSFSSLIYSKGNGKFMVEKQPYLYTFIIFYIHSNTLCAITYSTQCRH